MKIVYSKSALKDLACLLDFIFEQSPQNTKLVLDRIEAQIKLLASQTELGRAGRVPETRELVITKTPFVVPYQVRGTVLVLLRVYHAAQKWPNI